MPSPIAHSAAAYLVYHRLGRRSPEVAEERWPVLSRLGLLAITFGLSMLPDFDILPVFVWGKMEYFHNNASHSLLAGVLVAPLVGAAIWGVGRLLELRWSYRLWTLTALLCYELHVVMDYFTYGRGVKMLWPFDGTRYSPPMVAFHGVRWSEGWWTHEHLWTLANELGWLALVVVALHFRPKERR